MTSRKIEGTVKKVLERKWQNKTFYSLALEEHDELFGMGATRPKCRQGDAIAFSAAQNEKGYWDVQGDVLQTGNATSSATTPAVDRQDSILLQSSRKDALQFLDILIKTDSYPIPKGKESRMEALEAVLNDITDRFFWRVKTIPTNKPEPIPATLFDDAE
jgi:hypothetical protein